MLPPDGYDLHERLSVVETKIENLTSLAVDTSQDVKVVRSYIDRQRGMFAMLVIGAGAAGATIAKAFSYFASKVGIS